MANTATFHSLAQKAQAHAPDLTPPPRLELRRFSTWEISQFMFHLPADTLRKKLIADPSLPQGIVEPDGRQRWFSLTEVNELRRRLRFRKHTLLPQRHPGPAPRICVMAPEPNTGTTTLVQHLAHAAALDGLRVLIIDLTTNAGLSRRFDAAQIAPSPLRGIFSRSFARETDRTDQARPQSFIHPTHWPTIDIIPASPDDPLTDRDLTQLTAQNPDWDPSDALTQLLDDLPEDQFDLILMDCAPALGNASLSALDAANHVLIPFLATATQFAMTAQHLSRLAALRPHSKARIHLHVTRFRPAHASQQNILTTARSAFGNTLFPDPLAEIDTLNSTTSVYEQDYRASTRTDWHARRTSPDATYAALRKRTANP